MLMVEVMLCWCGEPRWWVVMSWRAATGITQSGELHAAFVLIGNLTVSRFGVCCQSCTSSIFLVFLCLLCLKLPAKRSSQRLCLECFYSTGAALEDGHRLAPYVASSHTTMIRNNEPCRISKMPRTCRMFTSCLWKWRKTFTNLN